MVPVEPVGAVHAAIAATSPQKPARIGRLALICSRSSCFTKPRAKLCRERIPQLVTQAISLRSPMRGSKLKKLKLDAIANARHAEVQPVRPSKIHEVVCEGAPLVRLRPNRMPLRQYIRDRPAQWDNRIGLRRLHRYTIVRADPGVARHLQSEQYQKESVHAAV